MESIRMVIASPGTGSAGAGAGLFLPPSALLAQVLSCLCVFLVYVIPSLALLFSVRLLTGVPSFVYRKMLHLNALVFSVLMILTAGSWQAAALAALAAAVLIFPLLCALERKSWYTALFVQKSPGEVRRSMIMIFAAMAAVVVAVWGLFGQRRLAAASIFLWGIGDASAALFGIPFGKHRVQFAWTGGKKSWEGSAAMLVFSFAGGFCLLLWGQRLPWPRALWSSATAAALGTLTELFTPGEWDTLTVPLVVAGALLLTASI